MQICLRINEIVRRRIGSHLLLKTMFIIDAMNLVDGVYGETVGASPKRSASFLTILERGNFGGAASLRQSLEKADLPAIQAVRGIRNKACAHLDPALTLRQLQSMVLDLDDDIILDRVVNPTVAALEEACAEDMTTRWLLMDEPSSRGSNPPRPPTFVPLIATSDRTTVPEDLLGPLKSRLPGGLPGLELLRGRMLGEVRFGSGRHLSGLPPPTLATGSRSATGAPVPGRPRRTVEVERDALTPRTG